MARDEPRRPRGWWQRFWPGDRRGATALVLAASASGLLGMAALATEGGLLYLTHRRAQDAADAAAMAAASAYNSRGRSLALAAAPEVLGLNHFSTASGDTITVNNPPQSGPATANNTAFEVILQHTQTLSLSRAIFGRSSMTLHARAVALLQGSSPACLLGLTGSVNVHDASSFVATGCAVASNANMAGAVNVPQNISSFTANSVVAVGTCTGCGGSYMHLAQGYQNSAAPLSNPYTALDAVNQPTFTGGTCYNTNPINVSTVLQPYGTTRSAFCGNVSIGNTSSLTFPAGTYVFQNASLTIGSLSSFTCNGCTFIFMGSNPGTINIGNMSTVRLVAPYTNPDNAAYNGMLFYRVGAGSQGSQASPIVNLHSVSSMFMAGGMYFPRAYVTINNLSSSSVSSCQPIVAGQLELMSLSSYQFSVAGCATYNTQVPQRQTPTLTE